MRLEALVNQSLLNVIDDRGHIRYRMLEMVREFGEAELATDPDASRRVDTAICLWADSSRRGCDQRVRRRLRVGGTRAAVYAESEIWCGCCAPMRRHHPGRPIRGGDHHRQTVFPVLAAAWVVRGLHAEVLAWSERIGTDPARTARRPARPPPSLLAGRRSRGDAAPVDAPQHQADRHRADAAATPALAGTFG